MMNLKIKEILPYIVIFLMFLYITRCNKSGIDNTPQTIIHKTEVVDTVYYPKDTIKIPVLVSDPKTFTKEDVKALVDGTYVDKKILKELEDHITSLEKNLDSIKNEVNLYNDTLKDTNITIITSDLIDGKRLNFDLKYTLKGPKTIIKTQTITKIQKQDQRNLYLIGRIGGNKEHFTFGPGLQYIDRKGRLAGYDYDVINNTHNISVGIKLFK